MRKAEFRWGALSKKQKTVLKWWLNDALKDRDGIIADGAIRSGKSVSMSMSFVLWAMNTFNGMNFAMCGKTIQSLRRNVIKTLKRQLRAEHYKVKEKSNENMITVSKGDVSNDFYLFGGKDEASQDLVQGITLAGAYFDEVALMPESFVNQATARCSVDGSKWWFNCNPAAPMHWFKVNWINKAKERNLLYLHFLMNDNLTLSERIRKRYENQFTGVFYMRYILGLWVIADGIIYKMFDKKVHVLKELPETEGSWYISSDFGISNATTFLIFRKIKGSNRWLCLNEWSWSGREEQTDKTVSELVEGMKEMISQTERLVGEKIEVRQVIVDPSAKALVTELRKNHFKVRKGDNDVLNGIASVQVMLKDATLLFYKLCGGAIKEFGQYAWDEKASAKGDDAPIKQNDHRMDAIRYFVYTLNLVRKDVKNVEESDVENYFLR